MSELPKGWTLTDLSIAGKWGSGGTPKRHNKDYYDGEIPWLVIGDLNDGIVTNSKNSITEQGLQNSSAKLIDKGTLLIAMYGSIGKLGIAGFKCSTNQAIAHCSVNTTLVNSQYLFYYLRSRREHLLSIGKGGAQQNISQTVLKAYELPLAPINEQVRIADKLDSILAKVNKAQSRLDKIPVILKRFRQSVLAAATSGELTKEWREDDGHQWRTVQLKDVGKGFNYGSSAKSKPEGDVPVLRMGNLQGGKLDWSNLVFTSDEAEIEKYLLETGDILFNRTNSPELVGKTSIYRGEQKAIYAGYLIRVKGSEQLNTEFLNIQLNSPHARDYCWQVKTDGVSQSNINAKKLQAYEFDLPPMSEQLEIVRRVNELFSRADLFERQYLDARKAFSRLTQSILAKAFRGELVPQDSNDESAGKLLKRIRKSVTNKPEKKPSPNIKKEKVEEVKGSDSVENSSKANLTSEASDTKDTLRAKYQAEIHKAQISLQGATFSVEQFSSLTEFKGGYVELKKLIMNLLKGVPGINEPLFEVESWDAKRGVYALRLVKS